jgi:hypothetical protein
MKKYLIVHFVYLLIISLLLNFNNFPVDSQVQPLEDLSFQNAMNSYTYYNELLLNERRYEYVKSVQIVFKEYNIQLCKNVKDIHNGNIHLLSGY